MRDGALEDNATERLQPWREKLIDLLSERPEGFTDGKKLIAGRPHDQLLPGYDPDRTYPFL